MTPIWRFSPDEFMADYQKLSETQRARAKRWAFVGLIVMGLNLLVLIIHSVLIFQGTVALPMALFTVIVQAIAWKQCLRFVTHRISGICSETEAVAEHDLD